MLSSFPLLAEVVEVRTDAELEVALAQARPGLEISLLPGVYTGGHYLEGIQGGAGGARFTIEGAGGPSDVIFRGGEEAFHFSNCSNVALHNFTVSGYPGNGINIDDGGSYETPSRSITLMFLHFEDIGPTGNHDALKLSGVELAVVGACEFRGWGGSAIDMVGCRKVVIGRSRFIGREQNGQHSGIQAKGGSQLIGVVDCYFENAGERAINMGGSTGLDYFRPADADYEAKDIFVYKNRFVGSTAPIAWVGIDGGHVHHNIFYLPEKWVGRILQESDGDRFVSCRNGVFEHNLIVYDEQVQTLINVGPNTSPETFVFRENAWFDRSGAGRIPTLPTEEEGGVYNVDPMLIDAGSRNMRIGSDDPRLAKMGVEAYENSEEYQENKKRAAEIGFRFD